jgi:hypothetical protein
MRYVPYLAKATKKDFDFDSSRDGQKKSVFFVIELRGHARLEVKI